MKIIRVFPRKTSYTPDDDYVFIGEPPGLFVPDHDEVHISCVFTWDKPFCEYLKFQWEAHTDKPVKIGGPAYINTSWLHQTARRAASALRLPHTKSFTPGMYVKHGIVFTSRGCNNKCPWCCVKKREGRLIELPIVEGNIIQDNNFLQCSQEHKIRVFEMLKTQKGICFKGGLQANLIDEHFLENITQLSIKELWLSCDTDNALPGFLEATEKLRAAGYTREHIHCYVLIGDDMDANEQRLQAVYNAGAMPFAQLYQPISDSKLEYSAEWRKFLRKWSRPAATKAHVERGTDMKDYNT